MSAALRHADRASEGPEPTPRLKVADLPEPPADCPACGDSLLQNPQTVSLETPRGETEWCRCPHCRAYVMLAEYEADAEAQHTQTMAWGQEDDGTALNEFKQLMFRAVLDAVRTHAAPECRILDIGCSFGGFLMEARRQGFDVMGVDIVPEAVSYVRSQGIPAERVAGMPDCPPAVRNFGARVVTIMDANIYWPDQAGELKAIYDLLPPEGLLVMRLITKAPFFTAGRLLRPLSSALSRRLMRRAVNDHRFSMPLDSMLTLLKKTGFEIRQAGPQGALHSRDSGLGVRSLFALGTLTWKLAGIALAPGNLVVAQKPAE